jgi:hypothetical protein
MYTTVYRHKIVLIEKDRGQEMAILKIRDSVVYLHDVKITARLHFMYDLIT